MGSAWCCSSERINRATFEDYRNTPIVIRRTDHSEMETEYASYHN